MSYVAFLLLWMQAEPAQPPIAAFIHKFETFKECEDFRARVSDPEVKARTSCMLVVVEPKKGIKE